MDDMFRGELWGRFGTPWNRLMRDAGLRMAGDVRLDMFEDGGTLVVRAELPGVAKDDLSVKVAEDTLLISGERRHEEKVERRDYMRVERNYGSFSRSIPLPEGVKTEEISATLKDGVLEVRLPRAETGKPVVHIDIS